MSFILTALTIAVSLPAFRTLSSSDLNPCDPDSYSSFVGSLLQSEETDWVDITTTLISAFELYFTADGKPTRDCMKDVEKSIQIEFEPGLLSSSDEVDIAPIYWAIATAADMAGQYSLSWVHLEMAHKLESKQIEMSSEYNRDQRREYLRLTTQQYRRGFWPPLEARIGSTSTTPVFIVGFFRSGSTLLESMLDAHPMVWGMGEESVAARAIFDLQSSLVRDHSVAGRVESYWSENFRQIVNNVAANILRNMTAAYQSSLLVKVGRVRKIVDKMLANYKNLALLHLLFPNAIIIHTVRDPIDTLLSCYRIRFKSSAAVWTLSISTLIEEYVQYLQYMQHYRSQLPANRLVEISYETLVASPEKTMRQLLYRLGLPWDDRVMKYHQLPRNVLTASALQVRKPIYRSSVGSWRRYKDHLGQLIDLLRTAVAGAVMDKQAEVASDGGASEWMNEAAVISTLLPNIQIPRNFKEMLTDIPMNWNFQVDFNYEVFLREIAESVDMLTLPQAEQLQELSLEQYMDSSHAIIQRFLSLGANSDEMLDLDRGLTIKSRADMLHRLYQYNSFVHLEPSVEYVASGSEARNDTAITDDVLLDVLAEDFGEAKSKSLLAAWVRRGQILLHLRLYDEAKDSIEAAKELIRYRLPALELSVLAQLSRLDADKTSSRLELSTELKVVVAELLFSLHERMTIAAVCQANVPTEEDCRDQVNSAVGGTADASAVAVSSISEVSCCEWHRNRRLGVGLLLFAESSAFLQRDRTNLNILRGALHLLNYLFYHPDDMNAMEIYVSSMSEISPWIGMSPARWQQLTSELIQMVRLKRGGEAFFKRKSSDSSMSKDEKKKKMQLLKSFDLSNSPLFWSIHKTAEMAGSTNLTWKFLEAAIGLEQLRFENITRLYNHKAEMEAMKRMMTTYKSAFWPIRSDLVGETKPSPSPIFLVGFGNCGVDLLADQLRILSSSAAVRPFREGTAVIRYEQLEEEILSMMNSSKPFASKEKALEWFSEKVDFYAGKILRTYMRQMPGLSSSSDRSATTLVDAYPLNYRWIGLIHLLFPNAPIIHVTRDPMDTLWETYRDPVMHRHPMDRWKTTKVSFEVLAMEYVLYLEAMQHFRREIPDRAVEVSFEAIASDFERTMKELVLTCGLSVTADMLTRPGISLFRNSTIGSWRGVERGLQPLKVLMQKFIPGLRDVDALTRVSTYLDVRNYNNKVAAKRKKNKNKKSKKIPSSTLYTRIEMNWAFDSTFDYDTMLSDVRTL